MSKWRNKILLFATIIFIVGIFVIYGSHKPQYIVTLANKEFKVEIAQSPEELGKGLSGRDGLDDSTGLLFVFDKPDNYGFWMKEMNFPIDIIWISSENKIVHIEKALSPETFPKIYYPNSLSLYVLEINAGKSDLLNLKTGDIVKFSKK